MLEYYPWSKAVLEECLVEYKNGKFNVLDIELGGDCNFTCIYCDSPDRKRDSKISLKTVECFLESRQFKWIHICGIGEPTFSHNYELLIKILRLCEKYDVKCNMFSNIYNLTDELIEFIKKEILYVLFKLDTLSNTHAANLYGIDSRKAQRQIENIEKITKLVKVKDGTTNLAASLVPTNINWPVIVPLVKRMCEHNIFPMIGDLENSGRGREYFETLNLNDKKQEHLERQVSSIVGTDYKVPQCPAVISSIHISTDNDVIVDEYSGLSCNWFWLEEPKLKIILTLTEKTSLQEVTEKLIQYRHLRSDNVKEWLEQHRNYSSTFGGCGGDIISLLETYLEAHESVQKYDDLSR